MSVVVVNDGMRPENLTTGVVLESSRGHYAARMLVEYALYYGWDDADARQAVDEYDLYHGYERWRYADTWYDITEDALTHLNLITEGGVWWWSEGDLRLDTYEDAEEMSESW